MWKRCGPIVGCCLAAMPLLGCVGGYTALPPQAGPPPAYVASAPPEAGVYTTRAGTPAAVLVFLPGADEVGDVTTRDPGLWAAQGFDVVMPRPLWTDRLIADQHAAVERLLASAQALADAPIWLVGPSPTIEAVMPQLGPGQVSGVVVTSVTSNAGSCTRTMYYSNPGTGAEPKAVVRTSGDACRTTPSFDMPQAPPGAVPVPQVKPNAPRLIEASIPTDRAAQLPFVQRLAQEIKAPQPAS
jgi:hypothetical protein